jgi:hypothetical protein
MSDEPFDPYYTWLSIPPQDQPPHHYRLLGLQRFESSAEVIERAADRQRTYLRQHQNGAHSRDSQQLLNEVSQAVLCLLNPVSKQQYDAQLRLAEAASRVNSAAEQARQHSDETGLAGALAMPTVAPSTTHAPLRSPRVALQRQRSPSLVAIVAGVVTAPLILALLYAAVQFFSSRQSASNLPVAEKGTQRANAPAGAKVRKSQVTESTPRAATTTPAAAKESPGDSTSAPEAVQVPESPAVPRWQLASGGVLAAGQKLLSENEAYQLEFQSDGNLVLKRCQDWAVLWASHTSGRAAACALQTDGNLVLSDAAGRAVWSSRTSLHPGAELVVQNDGNVVIYLHKHPLWSTNTRQR